MYTLFLISLRIWSIRIRKKGASITDFVYFPLLLSTCASAADFPSNFYNSATNDPYGNEITPYGYDNSPNAEQSTIPSVSVVTEQSSQNRPQCAQATTLTFCLDDATYPSADIIKDINKNLGVFYKMFAEVTNQSTSSLVEGVPASEEDKYDFAFYYGDRDRTKDTKSYGAGGNPPFRADYYKDGGYVCPAFIDYTGLFQATNARGEWQYIVNIKPWLQTVRIEQCFYPQSSCSYMSKAISTSCVQKYSYQRLIAYEPHGRGLYMDVFRLPTACSCYIRRGSRPSSPIPSASLIAPQFASEATQNVATRTGFIPPATSQKNPLPPAVAADSSSFAPYYAPKGGYKEQNTYSDAQGDSILVERRRLRPEPMSLGDMAGEQEADFNYQPNPPPWERRPMGPPPQMMPSVSRSTGMFALDEYTSAMDAEASRADPAYSLAHPNAVQQRRGPSNGFVPGMPNPGMPGDGPGPDGFMGGMRPRMMPPGMMLGPVSGPGAFGPPAKTYRPIGGPPLTFYDYNAGHMGGRSGRADNSTTATDNSTTVATTAH